MEEPFLEQPTYITAIQYISDLLTSTANITGRSTLRASSCGNLVVPQTRQRIGDRAFSVAAVSFCLRAPAYGLTAWCAIGLLVGGAIQVPQLQLHNINKFHANSISISSTAKSTIMQNPIGQWNSINSTISTKQHCLNKKSTKKHF